MKIISTLTSLTLMAMVVGVAPAIAETAAEKAAMEKKAMNEAAMKKDAMAKDAMKKEAMKKDAMAKDGMKKDEMKKDAMAKNGMKKDDIKKDAMAKDGMKKDGMMASHYVIKSGDSLWNIAKSTYGDGAMYTKILAANAGIDAENLMVGKTIDLPK
jgi:pentapeptide MXKDX repeat protein